MEVEALKGLKELKEKGPWQLVNGLVEWQEEEGLVWYIGKLYVPRDKEIRRDIIKACHDTLTAGNPGQHETYGLVARNYWWPGMSIFVKWYVEACDACNRTKAQRSKPQGPLQPNHVPEGPWQDISVDLITELPKTKVGHTSIIVYRCPGRPRPA